MKRMDQTRIDDRRVSPPSNATTRALSAIGDYRLLRRLGEGGMGEVFLAFHSRSQHQFAIKVLADRLNDEPAYAARFYREARFGAALQHPNIVRTFGASQDRATGRHFLVMEFVDGYNALALVEKAGQLPVGDAVHIALDIARALEHAHARNVIHRDIKPENILVTRAGVAKLLDFGLVKRTNESSNLTSQSQGFGTTPYMPYEQAISARNADHRSDLYALGATLYHLLTGRPPFVGESHLEIVEQKLEGNHAPASRLNPTVPRELDQIVNRLLAPKPAERYQTASELIVDLERSGLSADLPSFADPELARNDPWIQACRAAAGQPTRPDLRVTPSGTRAAPADVWLLRFVGPDGRPLRGRATTAQILERLREGRIPRDAEVCRAAEEGFLPVSFFPELATPSDDMDQPSAATVASPALPTDETPGANEGPLSNVVEPSPRLFWVLVAGILAFVASGLLVWTWASARP
jgi:serine/threonine-protein kinase